MLSIPKQRTTHLLCTALILIASFAPSTKAQTPATPTQPLEFEAATIKPVEPNPSGIAQGTDVDPDGIMRLNALNLKTMVQEAFNLNYWQIAGGEPWMEKNLYNVVAEPPDATRQSQPNTRHTWYNMDDPRLREMLQTLLIERFHLKVHRTTQIGKVFFLERTSKPLGLQLSKVAPPDPSSPQSTSGSIGWAEKWVLSNTTMPELANFASSYILHRPVLDHTGLSGAFDYRSPPDDPHASIPDQDSSFMQMLKDVGLKLTPSTGPTEILTIDHAELPSPN
jgi:uncharacterized protein (TIGR03435 family)